MHCATFLLAAVPAVRTLSLPATARARPIRLCSAQEEVLEPDYRLGASLAATGGVLTFGTLGLGAPVGAPIGLLGAFLASRARAVRFIFSADSFEVMTATDGELAPTGPNFAVGGKNRWRYEAIAEWAMYPSPEAPVLVYFRETQTRPSGQGHLFPILMDPKRLRALMDERVGEARRVSGPPQLS